MQGTGLGVAAALGRVGAGLGVAAALGRVGLVVIFKVDEDVVGQRGQVRVDREGNLA
jgi:hypothetical protein